MKHSIFLKPLAARSKHLPPAGLHPVDHIQNAGLNPEAPTPFRRAGFRRVRGPLPVHVHALGFVLLRDLRPAALIVLQTVVRPGHRDPRPPGLDRRGVDDRRRLPLTMHGIDVEDVVILVPGQPDVRRRVIPAEVHPADARPVRGNCDRVHPERFLGDREDAPRPHDRNAFGTRIPLVCRIPRNDPRAFVLRIVPRVVDRHPRDGRPGRLLVQKADHDAAHPQKWGKGQIDKRPKRFRGLRARLPFRINVKRWFFVKPNSFDRLSLPTYSRLIVTFHRHGGRPA